MLKRPVLLYDGTCGFCRAWIARLCRWDRAGRMDYVPYQQRAAVAGLPPITDEALDRAMHLVLSDGSVHAGAQALPLMLDRLPAGAVLKALFRIPGIPWLADRVYAWVAANRRRLAGSCGVRGPGPGLLAGPRDPGRFRNSQ